jgi:hypothetical protein
MSSKQGLGPGITACVEQRSSALLKMRYADEKPGRVPTLPVPNDRVKEPAPSPGRLRHLGGTIRGGAVRQLGHSPASTRERRFITGRAIQAGASPSLKRLPLAT